MKLVNNTKIKLKISCGDRYRKPDVIFILEPLDEYVLPKEDLINIEGGDL